MSFIDQLKSMFGNTPLYSPIVQPTREERIAKDREAFKQQARALGWSVEGDAPQVAGAQAQAPQAPQVPPDNSWSQAGRPATNPYSDVINQVFGNRAQNMEKVLRWGTPDDQGYGVNYGGENLSYNPGKPGDENVNNDGSTDRGLFQINSTTFEDFMRRKGKQLRAVGINSFDDMWDPRKNTLMANFILEEQGYSAWYGAPKDLR